MFDPFDEGDASADNAVPQGLALFAAMKHEVEKERLRTGNWALLDKPIAALGETVVDIVFCYSGRRLWRLYTGFVIRSILDQVKARVKPTAYRAFLKSLYQSIGDELMR